MAQASISTSDTRVESVGGLRIFVRFWRPTGKVRGVITLVPASTPTAVTMRGPQSNSRIAVSLFMHWICADVVIQTVSAST